MAEYRVRIEEEPSGCGPAVFIFLLIVIAMIVDSCGGFGEQKVTSNQTSNSGYHQSQSQGGVEPIETTIPNVARLTDLYVFDDHSDVLDTVRNGSVTSLYGKEFGGPYISLSSVYSMTDGWNEAYTEFVTGGNYRFLSGTFFANADYDSYEVTFRIYADGELVYDSGKITRKTTPTDFEVSIGNAQIIKVAAIASNIDSTIQTIHLNIVNAEVRK